MCAKIIRVATQNINTNIYIYISNKKRKIKWQRKFYTFWYYRSPHQKNKIRNRKSFSVKSTILNQWWECHFCPAKLTNKHIITSSIIKGMEKWTLYELLVWIYIATIFPVGNLATHAKEWFMYLDFWPQNSTSRNIS